MKTKLIIALVAVSLCGCAAFRSVWSSIDKTVNGLINTTQTVSTNAVDTVTTPLK